MTRPIAYVLLTVFAAAGLVVVAARPEWASDQNSFLRNFVTHEFLSLLGVILAITLASVANIHLEFNKIEERYQRVGTQPIQYQFEKECLLVDWPLSCRRCRRDAQAASLQGADRRGDCERCGTLDLVVAHPDFDHADAIGLRDPG